MLKDKSKVDVIYAHRSFIQMFNVSYTLMTFNLNPPYFQCVIRTVEI